MSDRVVIEARDVSKCFRLSRSAGNTLKSTVLGVFRRGKREPFWAVKDVSFSVREGEVLGLIGSNGAGKSTLLSLLAGTKMVTSGSVRVEGSVSSLLELGAGFHPDLTGRENVFLNGAIMGLSRAQMQDRLDAIVDFAELSQFIDQPVRHYSSGMYVRLGFAVAVEVDPDVLLIDEVLAVGDVGFQRKCLEKMKEFRRRGKTMLIISHDLATVQEISDRILVLDQGRVLHWGAPGESVGRYRAHARESTVEGLRREWGTREAEITAVRFLDSKGGEVDFVQTGATVTAELSYRSKSRLHNPVFGCGLADPEGNTLFATNTQMHKVDTGDIEGEGKVLLEMGPLPFASGDLLFSVSLHSDDHKQNYHRIDNGFSLGITGEHNCSVGPVDLPVGWRMG